MAPIYGHVDNTTPEKYQGKSFTELNAMLNLYDEDGGLQLDADKEAARQYFIQHVNQNTVFFNTLKEKLNYLVDNDYYEREFLEQYEYEFVKGLYQSVYEHKFRFDSFLGAYKFYTSYALKTFDGERYLERFEDRVVATALYLGRGDADLAGRLAEEMITQKFQPATPTFLNAGKAQRGELVSCFLLGVSDDLNSIGRSINSALQLSKRGGGVALNLTNLRESGAPIKHIENQSSGVVPVMKMYEDAFSYANQLGARQGAGAVYLHAHHPDIMKFLDTKRENADEKTRIKTLSLGVVIPDVTFELARNNEDMYLFSPYDVERIYGRPFAEVSVSENYRSMVDNPDIRKKKVSARDFFQTLAEVQFESGYPYILFEDTANRANTNAGRISMSNLCSEILQSQVSPVLNDDQTYDEPGKDISCNLGSLNIAKVMEGGKIFDSVYVAIRALTAVSDLSDITAVPSVARGNDKSHAVGLGQMNLHGYLGSQGIRYGSPEALEFVNCYFAAVTYAAIHTSADTAYVTGEKFEGFEKSKYARGGGFFDQYTATRPDGSYEFYPTSEKVKAMFNGIDLPSPRDWEFLEEVVAQSGMYNAYLQAVPPTGSISYINGATSSIHPVASPIEIRKEGKIGRTYYPAPGMTEENMEFFEDAYEIGYEKIIDTYAVAQRHVDQGLSLTLFFKDDATTRDLNRAQIYAWRSGVKTVYYARIRQQAITGTDVAECVSCML